MKSYPTADTCERCYKVWPAEFLYWYNGEELCFYCMKAQEALFERVLEDYGDTLTELSER